MESIPPPRNITASEWVMMAGMTGELFQDTILHDEFRILINMLVRSLHPHGPYEEEEEGERPGVCIPGRRIPGRGAASPTIAGPAAADAGTVTSATRTAPSAAGKAGRTPATTAEAAAAAKPSGAPGTNAASTAATTPAATDTNAGTTTACARDRKGAEEVGHDVMEKKGRR